MSKFAKRITALAPTGINPDLPTGEEIDAAVAEMPRRLGFPPPDTCDECDAYRKPLLDWMRLERDGYTEPKPESPTCWGLHKE